MENDRDSDEEDLHIVMDDLESLGYQKPLSLGGSGDAEQTEMPQQSMWLFNCVETSGACPTCGSNASQTSARLISVLGEDTFSSSSFNIELDSIEDKPWRKPGADMSDYFNYGFDESSWRVYCSKQKAMREESSVARRAASDGRSRLRMQPSVSVQHAVQKPSDIVPLTNVDEQKRPSHRHRSPSRSPSRSRRKHRSRSRSRSPRSSRTRPSRRR